MDDLRTYLRSLPAPERPRFAERCGTSLGYLHKAMSIRQRLGSRLVVNIERESNQAVRCESLRPDVDWEYLRQSGTKHPDTAPE